jgi:hypothetical protein
LRVLVLPLAVLLLVGSHAYAGPAAPAVAFVYQGEPDPNGADQAFLALGRRRGAAVVRETPGKLAEDPLGAQLARGIAAYQRLQFKEAIATLDACEREAVVRGGGALTQGELVDLYAHRAAARSALGDEGAAWDDLVAMVTLAPTRPLDPARFPPRLVEAARRAAEARTATARLTVIASPADALVVVDGEVVGRGHVELTRPLGRHLVRAERSGFVPLGKPVEVSRDAEVRLALSPATPPSAADLARRAQLAGHRRAVAAFVTSDGGRPVLALWLIDATTANVEARTQVADDERLTTGAVAAAVDLLLGEAIVPGGTAAPRRHWAKSPLLWGVVGGVVAAALAVGLGVGLTERDTGTSARVDLGPAR